MKFSKSKRQTISIILISVLMLALILFSGCYEMFQKFWSYEESLIEKYSDVNLYVSNDYDKLIEHSSYENASSRCKLYLPNYNNLQFSEHLKGFYILDGSASLLSYAFSFVLELQFTTEQEYEQFLEYEFDRCNYTDEFNVKYNDYICYVTTDENITLYDKFSKYPYAFGMICANISTLTVRYVYFSDSDFFPIDEKFERVFENTNCEW